jgi:ABC-type multidrug transport system ATPase subunit
MIKTTNLSKHYGRVHALRGLDLHVEPGEIYGLPGPNGAGKTTTLRLLLDLIRPTGGTISIFGLDLATHSVAIRKRLGYLPGDLVLYPNLTGTSCSSCARACADTATRAWPATSPRASSWTWTGTAASCPRATGRSSASCRRSCTSPSW